jgi:hypothetical protein
MKLKYSGCKCCMSVMSHSQPCLRLSRSERTPVLSHQPSRVNPRYAASCVGVSQASHSSEHQVRQPDLVDAAVCDDNNQPFGSSLEVPAHLFCPPPQVVEVLLIGVMAVGLVGECDRRMLYLPRPRIIEPQSLQLGRDIDLPEKGDVIPQLRIVRGKVHP